MRTIKETCYKGCRILLGNEKRDLLDKMIQELRKQGFTEMQIPNIQFSELFQNKVGGENLAMMFEVKDRADRDLCLAPEYTAVIQRLANTTFKFEKDVRVFYVQECFRGEKPQAGRYRQFTQLGVEIINPTKDYLDYMQALAVVLLPDTLQTVQVNTDVTRGLDYYKNGSRQLLFNTASRLYLIDQEGNNVPKFPIKLPAEASNGCNVVQNGNLKTQQILIACTNGQVYAYDLSGKPVSSWLFEPFLNGIVDVIKPVVMRNQIFYLVTSTVGKIILADARGRTREIADGLSPEQIRSLEILPADSGTNAQFMVYDSSGVSLYTLEGNRGTIFGDIQSLKMIRGIEGWPGSKSSVYLLLTADSLMLYSSPGKQECMKSLPMMKDCHLEADFDGVSRTWAGLIYPEENTFFLLADDCSIPGGFPVKGNSRFCVRMTKGDGKNKLLIASTDGNLYVYNLN